MEFISCGLEDTQSLANKLAQKLDKGMVILFYGDIGAGKTTFIQFLLKSLGVEGLIPSPTFSIMNICSGKDFPIYHFDLYRISSMEEIYELGFEDYINSKNSPYEETGLSVIEWPENAEGLFPKDAIKIKIEKLGETKRKFIIENLELN